MLRGQITLSNIDEIWSLAIKNQISIISMHVPSLVKSLDIYSNYRPETKIWVCLGQIIRSKFDEICPLAIPNQISKTINAHTKFGENPLMLHKLSSRNENMGVSQADNSAKFDENCPLAIQNQISTISMHIPSLVKIHWCLLKLSSAKEIGTDNWRMDGQTQGLPMWNHNTPPL